MSQPFIAILFSFAMLSLTSIAFGLNAPLRDVGFGLAVSTIFALIAIAASIMEIKSKS